MPDIQNSKDYPVTATTPSTAQQILIGQRNVIVESQRRNTKRLWVTASFDYTSTVPATFYPLTNGEVKFFSAKAGHSIESLWVYCDGGTQYLNWEGSEGSIERSTPVDFEDLERANWLADGNYVERWEQGFLRKLYHGRTGAYFKSENATNTPFKDWTTPELLAGVNTVNVAPWNNAISMRNSKDGVTKDEIYIGLPRAHARMAMRFDAMLPTAAHLGVNDAIWCGFEVNSAGGFATAWLSGNNGVYRLESLRLSKAGVVYDMGTDITALLTNLGAFSLYQLRLNYPFLSLLEFTGGAWVQIYVLKMTGDTVSDEKMIPFFANEGVAGVMTNIITDFQIGTIQVWELGPEPLVYTQTFVNPAANPSLTANVAGRQHVEVYAQGITAAVAVYVENGNDGTNFVDADALTLAITQPSGKKTVAKGYLNAARFVRVTINEHVAGTYQIDIRASEE